MADLLLEQYAEALDEFPLDGTADDKLRAAVKYAVLAPSSHNAQPWLFRVADGALELYADRARGLPVVDPKDRELVIGCGAALRNLDIGLRNFGNRQVISLFPDVGNSDLLARVSLDGRVEATDEDRALFRAIPRRHTHRLPFARRPVAASLLTALEIASVHRNLAAMEPALAALAAPGKKM